MKRLLLLLICLTLTVGLMPGCAGENGEDVEDKPSATPIQDDDNASGQADPEDVKADEAADPDSLESDTEGSEN